MKYRIINGILLLWDGINFTLKKEELFINGSKIEAIGTNGINNLGDYETINASDQLVMPGLINTHTHVYMNFMKNSADDLPFDNWLFDKIFAVEAKMSKKDFYWSTMLGCIEMIKTGTTSFLDMHICENECAKAAKDSGLRAFLGKCIIGNDLYGDGYESFHKALLEKDKFESNLLKFVLSPHSIYSCSTKMLSQIASEADKRNMLKHIHLSESSKEIANCLKEHRKTPVELLHSLDFLDNKTIAAHCVKINNSDIKLLHKNSVNVATAPSSNAKLGNGAAPIKKMLDNGINVCLGTDSAASNNTLNMFREMNILSLIHKAKKETAVDFSAKDVLKTATLNPAKALNMKDQIGIISQGAFADLIFLDLKSPSLFPNNDIISSLRYCANGAEVTSVMVNGSFLMRSRELTSIDSERIYYEAERIAAKYF